MPHDHTRRSFLTAACASAPIAGVALASGRQDETTKTQPAYEQYPAIDPELVSRIVGFSHANEAGVKELVEKQPELARAAWDWGFGDFETAIGAASHTGQRAIVEILIANGARPTLFTHAMLGHLDVVRAVLAADPSQARIKGPHGLTLAHHARVGREAATEVLAFLETIEGADAGYESKPITNAESLYGPYLPKDAGKGFVVEAGRNAPVTIRPEGSFGRNLFHLGGLVFHPPGAESARIAFDVSEIPTVMTIAIGGTTRRYVKN